MPPLVCVELIVQTPNAVVRQEKEYASSLVLFLIVQPNVLVVLYLIFLQLVYVKYCQRYLDKLMLTLNFLVAHTAFVTRKADCA